MCDISWQQPATLSWMEWWQHIRCLRRSRIPRITTKETYIFTNIVQISCCISNTLLHGSFMFCFDHSIVMQWNCIWLLLILHIVTHQILYAVHFCLCYAYNLFVTMKWIMGSLTHWGRVTQICVGKLIIIGSDNGLSPGRRQAIIWTNAGILLIWPLGTNFSEISIDIQTFSFKKIHFKMSSGNGGLFVSASKC